LLKILIIFFVPWLIYGQPSQWSVEPSEFEYYSTMTAQILVSDTTVNNTSFYLAAFSEDECRGVVNGSTSGTDTYFLLMIYGNTHGETITFKYYDPGSDSVFSLIETISFQNTGSFGSIIDPFLFNFNLHVETDLILSPVPTLHQNYPNPFNPITSLRYDLPEDGLVNITIYDMMGRIVKTLINSSQTAGYKFIRWNATNERNESVSAGLYLYTIQAGEFRQTKKMVLLK
jgi:hypothetical protein